MTHASPLAPASRTGQAVIRRRLAFAFGDRFFLLLIAGLFWIGLLFWSPRFLAGMIVWDLVLLGAWWLDLRALADAAKITVERSFTSPLSLREPSQVSLRVLNGGKRFLRIQIVDDVPVSLREIPSEIQFRIPAGQERTAEYSIEPRERGESAFGCVYVRAQTLLSIAQRWATVELQQTVRVYPSLRSKRNALYLARSRRVELERRLLRRQGQGREFEYLREYLDGDEARDICWTATARRGKPVTRVHRAERNQAVWIVLDCGRLMRAQLDDFRKLDFAVDAALDLAQVAIFGGDRVGLLAYATKIQERLAPGRGPAHLRAMVEQLSRVRPEASEGDHLRAVSELMSMQTRRSLIVWITDLAETAMTPEVIQAATQMSGRHIVLFVVVGQPELQRLAAENPTTSEALYRYTAAVEVLHRRDILLARMRERGALAMEVEANAISLTIMNQYLELKARGRF